MMNRSPASRVRSSCAERRPGRRRHPRDRARHAAPGGHRAHPADADRARRGCALAVYGASRFGLTSSEEGIAAAASAHANRARLRLPCRWSGLAEPARAGRRLAVPRASPVARAGGGNGPTFSEDDRLMWAPQAAAPHDAARRGQGQRDPRGRLRPSGPVTLHVAALLGGRRHRRPGASDGWGASSTSTATPTTRCRACRSTGRCRLRWPPRTCRSRRWRARTTGPGRRG